MDLKELQKQFDEISKQVKRETKSQPALALLFTSLISLFKVLFEMLNALRSFMIAATMFFLISRVYLGSMNL